jgi:hypothetical protein
MRVLKFKGLCPYIIGSVIFISILFIIAEGGLFILNDFNYLLDIIFFYLFCDYTLYLSLLSGFITVYFSYFLIIRGYIGVSLQLFVIDKLNIKEFSWLNKLILQFLIIYIIIKIYLYKNIIYLEQDGIINFDLEGVKFKIQGEYLGLIIHHFGAASAFGVGAKIAASFLSKHPMSLPNKIGSTILAGSGSSIVFQLTSQGNSLIIYSIKKMIGLNETAIILEIEDVNINAGTKIFNFKSSDGIDAINFLPKLKDTFVDNNSFIRKNFEKYYNSNLEIKQETKATIVGEIEKTTSKNLSEIFSESNINSPLESNEFLTNEIINLLNNEFILHLITIYLILMLILVFTIKYVIDQNLNLERIKSLPLGKYISYFIISIINSWKVSSVFWIYFFLFFILIFTCASTYGIFAILFVLKY